ncbi:hypothetical protein TUM19329_30160 [Legionella antarctica]|uniref:carbonic anhydrase n=1 Tax=Legionella antarctica TaxID=2708020 RepID=A0A6F8T7K0_9GAMM|nr:carbonic anhydrase [Legionella antarctica]BCA96655.1 hypothetical protein TUM19329_30160 [Legionella antarctica]
MLIKLMLGVLKFNKKPYVKMQSLFEQLGKGQDPETLFITCADSRINPGLITQAKPGELFVIRNIGNIIPPAPSQSSEAAAIEFALSELNIKDIIVCGHSQCGAMKGLLTPDIAKRLPAVASWLDHSASVLQKMHDDHTELLKDAEEKLSIATKQNILQQIEHLKTYPGIAKKLANNKLTIHGWLYEFESGKIFIYEPRANEFISLERALEFAIEDRKNKEINHLAMDYLEKLTHPKTAKEYQILMGLLARLQENIMPIWGGIKDSSQQKIWAELGNFYEGPLDSKFIALVESGSQIKLVDLNKFQKNIFASEGYRQHCSQLIQNSFFSNPQKPQDTPSNLNSSSSESPSYS